MLAAVRLVDEMDEQMWTLLQRNLIGITEAEVDWRPHPSANSVRWMLGHLAWFEEWAHDALRSEGRYLIDRDWASLSGALRPRALQSRARNAEDGFRSVVTAVSKN